MQVLIKNKSDIYYNKNIAVYLYNKFWFDIIILSFFGITIGSN